jgi:hypothetical protein
MTKTDGAESGGNADEYGQHGHNAVFFVSKKIKNGKFLHLFGTYPKSFHQTPP